MWFWSNISGPKTGPKSNTKTLLRGLGLAACLSSLCMAAAPPEVQPPPPTPTVAPLVDRSHAEQAYHLIRDWLTIGSFDAQPVTPSLRVSGVDAVCVTLRSSGLTMGTGQALAPTPTNTTPQNKNALQHPVDLVPLLRQAAQAAMKDAQDKAHDLQSRAAMTQDADDENKPAVSDLANRLQIDLQIAHAAEPLELTDKADIVAACQRFIPGYHGLRAVKPNAGRAPTTALVWPATALAANTSPPGQVRRLLADLGLSEEQPNQPLPTGQLSLQRFSVLHVVQPGPDQPPVVLTRGQQVIPTTSVSDRMLTDTADRLTAFLLKRKQPDGDWSGTYHPSIDRYDPATAPIEDLSLVAFVLGRRANFLNDANNGNHPDARGVALARDTAVDTLRRVLLPNAGASPASSHPAAALLLLTLLESQESTAKHKPDRDALAKQLLGLRRDDGWFTASRADGVASTNRPTQALIVAALTGLYEQTRDQALGAQVLASSQLLWQDAQPADVISALPWLAMAEFKLRSLSGTFDHADEGRWLQATLALAKAVDVLRDQLIRTAPPVGSGDVVGGFDLSPTPNALCPDPDWRTAHMLTYLALALGQEQLAAGQERLSWLLDCGLASRFLAQLMVQEAGCYYVRSTGDAVGAVRMKLWDNRLGVAPAAMTLLAVTELQQQIKTISR